MEKQPQSHAHLVAAAFRPLPAWLARCFFLPTIAVRQTIFLLSSAIHAFVGGTGSGRVIGVGGVVGWDVGWGIWVYFTATFPWHFYCWRGEVFDAQLLALLLKELKA